MRSLAMNFVFYLSSHTRKTHQIAQKYTAQVCGVAIPQMLEFYFYDAEIWRHIFLPHKN